MATENTPGDPATDEFGNIRASRIIPGLPAQRCCERSQAGMALDLTKNLGELLTQSLIAVEGGLNERIVVASVPLTVLPFPTGPVFDPKIVPREIKIFRAPPTGPIVIPGALVSGAIILFVGLVFSTVAAKTAALLALDLALQVAERTMEASKNKNPCRECLLKSVLPQNKPQEWVTSKRFKRVLVKAVKKK